MKLTRPFFERPTLEVAADLLGKQLVFMSPNGKVSGEINEVESYIGEDDPACHAAAGRTKRTTPLYLEGGYSYVYFIYGMYHCLNLVTEPKDCPAAILIRSVVPTEGIEIMKKNRGSSVSEKNLTNGPGKLCTAFGITRAQNAIDTTISDVLYVEDVGKKISSFRTTKRVGITKATENLWRFVYENSR